MASKTEEQDYTNYQEEIEQFRQKIRKFTEKEFSNIYLFQTLKALDFDFQVAELCMRKNVSTEHLFQFDTITKHYIKSEVLKKYDNLNFLGFDKDENPVLYNHLGNRDEEGIYRSLSVLDLNLHIIYWMQTCFEAEQEYKKKCGKPCNGVITFISDYENFTLQHAADKYTILMSKYGIKLMQELYPGVLKRVFIVNAPAAFTTLFNVLKACVKIEMIEKTIICSKESTAEELLKFIDEDTLPVFLGGKRVDENGDPRCSAFMNFGGKIPEESYSVNRRTLQFSDEGVLEITVPAWNSSDVLAYVEKPGSKIHLEFRSYEPITFSILIRKINSTGKNVLEGLSEAEELFGPIDVHSQLTPVDNILHCSISGIYVFRFDNTGSWVESKYVVYRIRILPPPSC